MGCGRGREQRGGEKFETEEGEKYEMDGEEVGKGNLPCVMRRQGSARLCTRRPVSKPTSAMTVFLFIYRDVHMALAIFHMGRRSRLASVFYRSLIQLPDCLLFRVNILI